MVAIFNTGYHGKTVDMEEHSNKHRTSISLFLHNDQKDALPLEKAMKQLVIRIIYEEAQRKTDFFHRRWDDRIQNNTVIQGNASNGICKFSLFTFGKKTGLWSLGSGVLLSCNGIMLNYIMTMYDKSVSKINVVKQIVRNSFTSWPWKDARRKLCVHSSVQI